MNIIIRLIWVGRQFDTREQYRWREKLKKKKKYTWTEIIYPRKKRSQNWSGGGGEEYSMNLQQTIRRSSLNRSL